MTRKTRKTAMDRHLAAIIAGQGEKTNIIGLRKAFNHIGRVMAGWSGNRSNATLEETNAARTYLTQYEPLVRGSLHESGVRVLTNKRWAKRFNAEQRAVIETLHGFRLVRFDPIDDDGLQFVPVYRAVGEAGSFLFRNVAWQAAAYGNGDIASGPVVIT